MLFNKHLYLAAYDTDAQAERLFRHDRMEKVQANRQSPSKADFKSRAFDASEYLKLPFQFGEETFTAKLRFDASCAWQTGTLCMQRGSIEQNGDGSATWTVDAADAGKLAGWCAQNGPGIRPLEPQAAVDAYRDGLAAVLANGGAADGRPDGNGGAR